MSFIQRVNDIRKRDKEQAELNSKRVKSFSLANIGASAADSREYTKKEDSNDSFENLRLVSRYASTQEIDLHLEGFKRYSVGRLLAKVHPPNFRPPSDDQFCVYGIVAKRNEVRQSSDGKKYVSLLLCDLNYEILLTIFGAAFDKYYKIRPGTLIAVCNPRLAAMKSQTNVLTMSVSSQGSPLLEIGRAKDLGQCSSEVNDSKSRCKNWVNLKNTEVCEYHQELKARRVMAKRPELNSVPTKLHNPVEKRRKLTVYSGGSVKWMQGMQYDTQAPPERIYQTGAFKEDPDVDRALPTPARVKKLEAKKLEKMKAEIALRQQLARRPDGEMLRVYEKGVLKNPELYETEGEDKVEAFSREEIKRIGFNPSLLRQTGKRSQASPHGPSTAHEESDSDDLEII